MADEVLEDSLFARIKSVEQKAYTRKLILKAGVAYGLLFGLGFALFVWGHDAYVLASVGAASPWVKLAVGLPLALLLCGLAGWLAALPSMTAVSVLVWAATCAVLGWLAGHVPFEGSNLVVWLLDRRLWGETVLAYTESAGVRTTLMIFICALLGVVVGFFESLAVQWAWDRATPGGKLSLGSWFVLLVGVPLALLPALTVNAFIHRPLRLPQEALSEALEVALAGVAEEHIAEERLQSSYRSVKPYLERLTGDYVSHFVVFGSETGTWHSAYVDVVFDDVFVMRCVNSGDVVIYCDDFSRRLAGWMNDLVRAGMYDEYAWLDARPRRLAVDESVVAWLLAHRDRLSETYELRRAGQQFGWTFIHARFDTTFEMVCRFRDAQLVVVDQCMQVDPSTP